ncbi:transposase [Clostridium sulfidigenes]|uniref:transposase n=1 Tax=Clostridium sulfidigenes TaxID=318464 RepID=UPI003F88B0E1
MLCAEEIVKKINMLYSIYFNRKYDLIGHLFQVRYRSELIQEDKYILEVSRYIHLNPLRANMVTNVQDYKWSSYSTYLGLSKEKIINTERILSYFGEINARKSYKVFIDNGIR